MSLEKNNFSKLIKLCEYMKCPTVVYLDGNETQYFGSLQDLINRILDDRIYDRISDFDTYWINFIGVQSSIFDNDDSLVCVYMI